MGLEIYELLESGELKARVENEYICKNNEIKYYV